MAVKSWLKLLLDIVWALVSLSILHAVYQPQGSYWTIISRVVQVRSHVDYYELLDYLKTLSKALLAAAIIVFVEKLFLHFVAINFHQKALADRLEENRLGLKALDCLSNVLPVIPKKSPHHKRGHKRANSVGTVDLATLSHQEHQDDTINMTQAPQTTLVNKMFSSKSAPELQRKKRRKKVASVIVDQVRHLAHRMRPQSVLMLTDFPIYQVGGAIGQVALKNSKFHRRGDFTFTGLDSARKMARKLFSVLSDVKPERCHLVVEGKFYHIMFLFLCQNDMSDFYPYFRSTSEAVSFILAQLTNLRLLITYSTTPLSCLTRTVMATYQNVKCEKPFSVSTGNASH